MQEETDSRITSLRECITLLTSSKPFRLADVIDGQPREFNVEGIYCISTPADDEIVYVGKTRSKSVIGRMKDHRSINTNSDLKGMLKLFPEYPQSIDDYLIRCIEVTDSWQRAFTEHFAIGVLQPPFNKQC